MKKYSYLSMALTAILSSTSCSSEDNERIENKDTQVMVFTATQEATVMGTKAAVAADGQTINWEEGDKISLFDGIANRAFSLKSGAESTEGTFEGTAETATSYIAVYPYLEGMALSGSSVENVTLPATQNATANGFDKNAAMMMAESTNKTLSFKNAVGHVKVTPQFDCKQIELKAFDNSAVLAGSGTLSYNGGEPMLDLSMAPIKDYAITLEGTIKAGNAYLIAVPAVTLKAGWTLKFTATDDKVYSRKGTKDITFKRNTVTNLGMFATDGTYWYDPRGNVAEVDEVDMGLTVTIGTKNYKVIFAKSNLTATGLAEKETDFGGYFAWAATELWYTSCSQIGTSLSFNWKIGKTEGYVESNAPYYNTSRQSYSKYLSEGDIIEANDDAAQVILGGDWRLPTKEIWQELIDANNTMVYWGKNGNKSLETVDGIQGIKISKIHDSSISLFLPAAGLVWKLESYAVTTNGLYWTGSWNAYYLNFYNGTVDMQPNGDRCNGWAIRPIRLVAVE